MAGLRGALAAAVMTGGVLLGAVACGGSSTVESPNTGVDGEPTSLPATAPGSQTSAPSGYPDSASSVPNAAVSAKDKAFIDKIHKAGIKAPDDVIINVGQFACEYDRSGRDSKNLEPFVVGNLSPWDGDAATANAKKFIAEARASYCKG